MRTIGFNNSNGGGGVWGTVATSIAQGVQTISALTPRGREIAAENARIAKEQEKTKTIMIVAGSVTLLVVTGLVIWAAKS